MQNTLKSNWLGSKTSAPTIFRPASKGKIFTRSERLSIIFAEKAKSERKNARQELILRERNKAKAESEARSRFFQGVNTLRENEQAKVRHSKDGKVFIQPRVNGSFGRKIEL